MTLSSKPLQQQLSPKNNQAPARSLRNTAERKQLHNGTSKEGDNSGTYGAAEGGVQALSKSPDRWVRDSLRWLENSEDTDPAQLLSWCCPDEFKPRKIKAPLVLGWLAVQLLGLVFQISLYLEVQSHLWEFEDTLKAYCSNEHLQNGVCLGPAWNLSYSGNLSFPPAVGEDSQSDFDFVIPSDQIFSFNILSTPPTFLIGIEPLPPNDKAPWKVGIGPSDAGGATSGVIPPIIGTGSRYRVITHKTSWLNFNRWVGSMSLRSKFPESVQVHVYVVDSRVQHLEEIHKQDQCSFEDSWQNFNERHSGEHHRVLSYARMSTGFFLMVSMVVVGVVLHRFYFYIEGGKLLSRIIALKFVVQDIPQQLCLVAYIYAWYASNGLRCQMCLFHPLHCDAEHPLHSTNLMVSVFTMLSASSNQMLVQAKVRRNRDEEDECFLWFVRFALLSVSILPFSTAIFFLSASILHLRSVLIYFVFGVPTLLGWGACLCVPAFALCDEED